MISPSSSDISQLNFDWSTVVLPDRLVSSRQKDFNFCNKHAWERTTANVVKPYRKTTYVWGAAIAQWIRLHLPYCCPGFESQAHHLRFLQFILFKLYICHLGWNVKRTKIKRSQDWPVLKKSLEIVVYVCCNCSHGERFVIWVGMWKKRK